MRARAAGLIAAAGSSARMGTPKALLPFAGDVVFVQRLAEIFVAAGLDPVIVTVPDDRMIARDIRRRLDHLPLIVTRNERPADGLTGSVITALEHAAEAEALVLSPVDCPFVDVALVQTLVIALRLGAAAVPNVDGKRGHPAVFTRPTFELLWSAGARGGPRGVLEALGSDVVDVPWSDPRVTDDVDTPEDYQRLFGRA
jgi:molybdenum cofactor cytidylyltransferase